MLEGGQPLLASARRVSGGQLPVQLSIASNEALFPSLTPRTVPGSAPQPGPCLSRGMARRWPNQ